MTRILFVCSYNSGRIAPFITEQAKSLQEKGLEISLFLIKGRGIKGYLSNLLKFKRAIRTFNPDLIHAHYGLSGLFSNLQFKTPVVTTFHGSDVNKKLLRPFSFLAMLLSKHSIFVSKELANIFRPKRNYSVIACAVDMNQFSPVPKEDARKKMNLTFNQKIVLFSSAAIDHVKNYPLAKAAVAQLDNVQLIELKGYSREQVNLLMNACDVALMTSFTEGSPQFIKEALACNCPIVSTDIGNVKWLLGETNGCYLTSFKADDVAIKLKRAIQFSKTHDRTKGRERMFTLGLDSNTIAGKIIDTYNSLS